MICAGDLVTCPWEGKGDGILRLRRGPGVTTGLLEHVRLPVTCLVLADRQGESLSDRWLLVMLTGRPAVLGWTRRSWHAWERLGRIRQ